MSNQAIYTLDGKDMKESDSDSYGTPTWLYDYLKKEHEFEIDLCASDLNHKELIYFTIEDDSLSKNWSEFGGIGFCNPPFSRGKKELFLDKAYQEMVDNGFSSVFVIPADITNKAWMQYIFDKATKITVINGRVNFNCPLTLKETKNGLGIAIVEFYACEKPTREINIISRDEIKKLALNNH